MINTIEVSGTITKKESLVSVNPEISNNALILETAHAFPGYHGIVPEEEVPGSLFLITKKKYPKDAIIRSAMAFKKSLKMDFDMVASQVTLQNNDVDAIRIKGLNNYTNLYQLIQALYDEGYRFQKSKKVKEFTSIIIVDKESLLVEIEPGFYHDKNDNETYYFAIEEELKWYAFEKAIIDIKYNTDDNNFDAALATFYRANGLVDVVRIYKKDISLEELKKIKDKVCSYIHA
jgi:hypothetical protein